MLTTTDNTHEHQRAKLHFMVNLPYEKQSVPIILPPDDDGKRLAIAQYLETVRSRLDERLYGMDRIKNRIVNMIHNRLYSKKTHSILCLRGPPGVGKTALASAIAYASDLPFDKISIGGMTDTSVFKGSSEVWVGSQPSIIVKILCKLKVNNPVILLDELDKANGHHGHAVQNAVFEILDAEQNHSVKDTYLNDFDHDFSNILWVISVNNTDDLHPALLSRLDVIDVDPYTDEQTSHIIREYLIPSELKTASLPPTAITIDQSAIQNLIKLAKPGSYNSSKYRESPTDIRIIRNMIRTIVLNLNVLETYRKMPPIPTQVQQTGDLTLRFKVKRPRITFTVDDFNGFPYQIKTHTIESIIQTEKESRPVLSYFV
jgi:ATP-dependent Lon protease